MLSKISTSSAPAAIGPYSQAIIAGNLVFVSGQLPIDPATGELGERDISVQTRLSIENIRSILTQAGLDLDSVVKTTVYLRDMGGLCRYERGLQRIFYRRMSRPRGC